MSYRRAEPDVALRLHRALSDAGCSVFIDSEHIVPSDPIPDAVEAAARGALIAVAVITPRYFDGEWAPDEWKMLRRFGRSRSLPIVEVLSGIDLADIKRADWRDDYFLDLDSQNEQDVVAEIVKTVKKQRRRFASYHLPVLARAAAAVASRTPVVILGAIGCRYDLPVATPQDQWYAAIRLARRAGLLIDLLSEVVETTKAPWDPRTLFLRARIGNPLGADPPMPARASAETALRSLGDASMGDPAIDVFHRLTICVVAPRLAETLKLAIPNREDIDSARKVMRRVGWLNNDGGYANRGAIFAVAADALSKFSSEAVAALINPEMSGEETSLLTTVALWSAKVAAVITDDFERELAAPRDADRSSLRARLERQLLRLRILSDAGSNDVRCANGLLHWTLAAGFEERAVDVLQQSGDERLESYAALCGSLTKEPFRIVLSAIRRLVESGANSEVLEPDLKLAVRAALHDAPPEAVHDMLPHERARRMWLWMAGPDLTGEQRDVLRRWVSGPRFTRRAVVRAAEARAILDREQTRAT